MSKDKRTSGTSVQQSCDNEDSNGASRLIASCAHARIVGQSIAMANELSEINQ